MSISMRTWVSKDGSQVDLGYGPDKQHDLYLHESVPDAMVVTLFKGNYEDRMLTTVGEIRAFLAEKKAQAEAAEVAARQATETPEPPAELLPAPVPESDGPVTTPVTRYEDTEGGDNEHGVVQPIDEL